MANNQKNTSESRLALRYLRLGYPEAKLIDTLTFAAVREDLDFHNLQVLEAGFTQGRIDAGGQDVAVDGIGGAQHKACDREAAEEISRTGFPGRGPAVPCR